VFKRQIVDAKKSPRDAYRFVYQTIAQGRPGTPMPTWGLGYGGPMNDQQIDSLIAYLHTIQIPMDGCAQGQTICDGGHLPKEKQQEIQKAIDDAMKSGTAKSVCESIFNLTLDSGAYSCSRCHTKGWSYGDPQTTGGVALGPNLTSGDEARQFPSADDNYSFVQDPPEQGKKYGEQGQSSGRMPAFGAYYSDEQLSELVNYIRSL